MERNTFVKEFGFASSSLDKRKIKKLVKKSVNANQDGNPRGHHNLIIVMEELSELSKEVSKQIRDRGDIVSLTEGKPIGACAQGKRLLLIVGGEIHGWRSKRNNVHPLHT